MPHDVQHHLEYEETLRPYLPAIEITKVTLDLKGPSLSQAQHNGMVLVRNPHIDPMGTYVGRDPHNPFRRLYSGFLDVDTLSRKDRAGMMDDIAGQRTMNIKLNLAIKEFSKGGFLTRFSLLDIEEIRQTLKVRVVLTDNMDDYEAWLRADPLVWTPHPVNPLLPPTMEPIPSLVSREYSWSSVASTTGPDGALSRFEEIEEGGRRVTVYPFEISIPQGLPVSPDNLGVIVYSYFDISSLAGIITNAVPSTLSPESLGLPENLESRRNSLLIIKDGEISSTSYVFHDLRQRVWNGPYHWMRDDAPLLHGEYSRGSIFGMQQELRCLEDAYAKLKTGTFRGHEITCGGTAATLSTIGEPGIIILSAPLGGKITEELVKRRMKELSALIERGEEVIQVLGSDSTGLTWMTGPTANHQLGMERPLIRSSISSPKVQDFRIFEQVQNIEFDFSIIENNIHSALKKDLRNNRIDINQAQTYFSDIFLSRDINDSCRFFFTIDWQRMVVENSIFGNLCKKQVGSLSRPGSQEILDITPIISLKLYRSRVEGSSETGSKPIKLSKTAINPPNIKPKVFEENQIDELIISTFEDPTSGLLGRVHPVVVTYEPGTTPVRQEGAPSIIIKSGISEMASDNLGITTTTENHLRHFTGMDTTVSGETDGYYQYRVEFEILDKSVKIIEDKRNAINGYITGLKKYYKEATKVIRGVPGIAPDGSVYLGGNIGGRTEQEYQRGEMKYGNFNSTTNHFTNAFAERYAPAGAGRNLVDIVNTPGDTLNGVQLRNAILGFVGILEFFANTKQSLPNPAAVTKALLDYINPWSGTPESINAVIRLMESISSKIGTILGAVRPSEVVWQGNTPNQTKIVVEGQSHAKNRAVKINHRFEAIFNANQESYLGFDFLNTTLGAASAVGSFPTSLYQITKTDFDLTTKAELEKLWTPAGSNLGNLSLGGQWLGGTVKENAGAYFTPHRFVLPGGPISPPTMMPEESFVMPNSLAIGRDPIFLRPVSYSLYGKRTGGKFLSQIREALVVGAGSTIGARTSTPAVINDLGKLANDLTDYFTEYHDTDIVTPDNVGQQSVYSYVQENVSNRRASTPEAGSLLSTQTDEGFGDEYYRTIRRLSQTQRERAYDFLFATLKRVQYNPEEKANIPNLEMPLQIEDWDLYDSLSKIRQKLPSQDSNNPENHAILTAAPSQIKSLLYYSEYISDTPPSFQPRTLALNLNLLSVDDSTPEFIYKTQVINQIEYLQGYQMGQLKVPYDPRNPVPGQSNLTLAASAEGPSITQENVYLLKNPIWTKTISNNLQGLPRSQLVCRSIPYENQTLAMRRSKSFDLPVYDEYFILDAR